MFGAQRVTRAPMWEPQPRLDLATLPDTQEFEALKGATEADAYFSIWKTGIGLELLLHEKQLDLATIFFKEPRLARLFLLIARRWGKTTLALWLAEKIGRTKKNAVIRFAYPTKEQAKTILIPVWEQLTESCPPELRWKNRESTDACWYLEHTNARLYLAGTDTKEQVDRLRGPRSDYTVVDEPGSHGCDLKYLVNSVLGPQLLTTGGKMLFITTPPTSMEHQSVEFINTAKKQGRFYTQTVHDIPEEIAPLADKIQWCREMHPDATEEEIQKIFLGEAEGDPAWEREGLCKLVSDKSLRVTPEFSEFKHVGTRPVLRYRDRYVLGDAGFAKDFFALLFCELDWSAGILWVCRELLRKRAATKEMVRQALVIESELWPQPRAPTENFARIFDADPRTIADFCAEKYPCRYAGKSDGAEKMTKMLQNRLHAGSVMVDRSCSKHLIPQLRDGIFKSDPLTGAKLDFLRTKEQGHLDGIAALAAGIRHVHWNHNPAPAGYLFDPADTVHPPAALVGAKQKTQLGRALSKAISLKGRLMRG